MNDEYCIAILLCEDPERSRGVWRCFEQVLTLALQSLDTGLCNHKQIVFEELSCWTALKRHIGVKTAF